MATADLIAIATATTEARQTAGQGAPARPARDHLKRLREQAETASALGISLRHTAFELGTELISVGVDKARRLQRNVNAKPLALEALPQLRDRVIGERRRDVPVLASELRIDPQTGRLKREGSNGKPGLLLTPTALGQLCGLMPWAPDGAGMYLGTIDPEWRASEWGRIAGHVANVGYPLVLRTRQPDPESADVECFAAVTSKYVPVDPDQIATTILSAVESDPRLAGLRAEIHYSGTQTRIHLIDHTDLQPTDTRVGDVLRATSTIRSSDDKTGGIGLWVSLLRVLCVNLTTGVSRGLEMSLRHTGDRNALVARLAAGIEEQLQAGAAVVHGAWEAAARNTIAAEDVLAIVRRLTAAEEGARKAQALIQVPGTPSGALLNYILEAYALEPEPSQIGVVNAITRAPQVGAWADPEAAGDALANAGGLLLQMTSDRFKSFAN